MEDLPYPKYAPTQLLPPLTPFSLVLLRRKLSSLITSPCNLLALDQAMYQPLSEAAALSDSCNASFHSCASSLHACANVFTPQSSSMGTPLAEADHEFERQSKARHHRRLRDRWRCNVTGHSCCYRNNQSLHVQLTDTELDQWVDSMVRLHGFEFSFGTQANIPLLA
jgi:hypothetical protein